MGNDGGLTRAEWETTKAWLAWVIIIALVGAFFTGFFIGGAVLDGC